MQRSRFLRAIAAVLIAWSALFFTGCSSAPPQSQPPPYEGGQPGAARGYGDSSNPQLSPTQHGLTGRQKLIILGGAAALYYLYKHHQSATSGQPQYYLSRNGSVYYRDAQHQVHWVQAPAGGIQVPQDQAAPYQQFQGYDGRSDGRTMRDVAPGN